MILSPSTFETIATRPWAHPNLAMLNYNESHLIKLSPDGQLIFVANTNGFYVSGLNGPFVNRSDEVLGKEEFWGIQPMSVQWHPEGKRFAVGSFGSGVRLMELDDSAEVPKIVAWFQRSSSVDALAFSTDGQQLFAGNRGQRIDIYDLDSNEQIGSMKGHLSALRSVAVSPSGNLLASAANDGAIKIWDLSKSTSSKQPAKAPTFGSGESPDGRWGWQQQGTDVLVTDTANGEQVAKLEKFEAGTVIAKFFPEVDRVVFWQCIYHQGSRQFRVVSTRTWRLETTLNAVPLRIPWSSAAGDFFVTSFGDGNLYVFNGRTAELQRWKAHSTGPAVALSPNGERLLSAEAGEIKLWDTHTGMEIANFFGHRPGGYLPCIGWDHQGRYFATASIDQTIKIWNAQEKKLIQTLRGLQSTPSTGYFSFSLDDSSFLGADAFRLKVWDIRSGRELFTFTGDNEQHPVIFDEFRFGDIKTGLGLSEQTLRFAALAKAEALNGNSQALENFEHQTLYHLARELLTSPADLDRDSERVLALSNRALELNPTDPEYLFTHSLAAYRTGHYEESLRTLKLSTDSGFRNLAVAQLLEAVCLKRMGKVAEAQQVCKRATETLKQSPGISTENQAIVDSLANEFLTSANHGPAGEQRIGDVRNAITVTTLADKIDASENGKVSLREAVAIIADGGTIDFDVEGTIELQFGPILIKRSMNILGPGQEQLAISGGGKSRLLIVDDSDPTTLAQVSISGVRLTRGFYAGRVGVEKVGRGAIWLSESLTMEDCLIDENHLPQGTGGAICAWPQSILNLARCSFISNSANLCGAVVAGDSLLNIDSCTFERNSETGHPDSAGGSAVRFNGGVIRICNSTFSNNRTVGGGALALTTFETEAHISHCTFTENVGGGIFTYMYPANIPHQWDFAADNCIFFGNTDMNGKPLDVWSKDDVQVKISHSIIGVDQGGFIDGGDNLIGVDPQLGPLADNGGPTKTYALLEGSPAIDAGSHTTLEFDQRGKPYLRTVNGRPDIGAFEFQSDTKPN